MYSLVYMQNNLSLNFLRYEKNSFSNEYRFSVIFIDFYARIFVIF